MNRRHHAFWPEARPYELPLPATNVAEAVATSAQRYPDRPAIVFYDSPISYARLWREIEALAGWLQREAGVARGDRVLLYGQNSPQFVIAYFAIARAGAVVVPLNPMLVEHELGHYVEDSGAVAAVAAAELAPRLHAFVPQPLRRVVVATYADYLEIATTLALPPEIAAPPAPVPFPGAIAWRDALAAGAAPRPIDASADDLALLPYTSGTTGLPKGCVHTHRTVWAGALNVVYWRNTTPGERVLSVLPFFHVTGMNADMTASLIAGATIVLLSRWDAANAIALLRRYRPNRLHAIATIVVDLLAHPDFTPDAISSLHYLGGGGAPLPTAVGEELVARFGLRYVEAYGMTETMAGTHANPPARPKLQCAGIPMYNVDSRIVDPETLTELGPGEVGEIVTAAPQLMREYWRQPQATAEAFFERDGARFLRTGDLGYVDDDGYFFIVDRLKRMINVAGFKVWPAEVETQLFAHPAIQEACVIATSDARRGEQAKAVIVLRDGARVTADEIRAWARDRMAAYKVPAQIAFVPALPRSGSGKVLWRELQAAERALSP